MAPQHMEAPILLHFEEKMRANETRDFEGPPHKLYQLLSLLVFMHTNFGSALR